MRNEQAPSWEPSDEIPATDVSAEIIGDNTPTEEARPIEPEIINDSDKDESRYRPRFSPKVASEALKGNFLPMLAAVRAIDGTQEDFEERLGKVKATDALNDLMEMPMPFFKVGERVATNAEALAKVLMNKALAGDMSAIREILNRTEGKVPNVTHNKSASVKVTGDADSIGALMRKMDKNNKGD